MSVKTTIVFVFALSIKKYCPDLARAVALTLMFSYFNSASGRDGINIAVTIEMDLLQS